MDNSIFKTWYDFNELNLNQLLAILKIRQDVFMLEQQSLYEDIDDLDQQSLHLTICRGDELWGYGRLRILDDLKVVKFERIVTAKAHRGKRVGVQIIDELIAKAKALRPGYIQKLSAQVCVKKLYEKWGFEVCGEEFDDGGIAHINMKR